MRTPTLLRLRFAKTAGDGDEPLRVLATVTQGGALLCAVDLSELPPLDRFDPAKGYIGWTFALPAV